MTGVVDTLVSFRHVGGFDAQLLDSLPDYNGDAIPNKVLVHQWYRAFGIDTIYLRALGEGETYEEHGVTVHVDGIYADDATVTVSRAPYWPTISTTNISPAQDTAEAGEFLYFKISVQNTNDPATQSFDSNYEISLPDLGPGWVAGWTTGAAKTVPPGEAGDFDFVIISPGTAATGSYPFSMDVTDEDGDGGPVTALASGTFFVPEPSSSL